MTTRKSDGRDSKPALKRPALDEILKHADGETFLYEGHRFIRRGDAAGAIFGSELFDGRGIATPPARNEGPPGARADKRTRASPSKTAK